MSVCEDQNYLRMLHLLAWPLSEIKCKFADVCSDYPELCQKCKKNLNNREKSYFETVSNGKEA